MKLTQNDLEQIAAKHITEGQIEEQLKDFKQGFPYLRIEAPASVKKGILSLGGDACEAYGEAWRKYRDAGGKVLKFVPASGAASRMFKNLFAFVDAGYDRPETDFEKHFFDEIHHFAFFHLLDDVCRRMYGKDVDALIAEGCHKAVVKALLTSDGLNYGNLPTGLLKFHDYGDTVRTPLEEHLVEGEMYARGNDGHVNIHFTVSPEHRRLFESLVEEKKSLYEARYGSTYNVTFSEQKSSTDTIAVDLDNQPFRVDGKLLFRPGGHGALIQNLNDLDYDIIFIKNIDNVVPDRLKGDTVTYKQVIAGVLVTLQQRAFGYLRRLDEGGCPHDELMLMLSFLENELFCHDERAAGYDDVALAEYLRRKLDRPMRVCGMVKNVGEPGGGPFLAYNQDGTVSLQILESSQIDMKDSEKKVMFENGTHFNPVDLVCAVRDYRGGKFDLTKYVDRSTGFISH